MAALTLATPTGSLAGQVPSDPETLLERWWNGDQAPRGAEGRFAELSFTGLVGTPFEFSVDWAQKSVSIVPLTVPPLELPDPDAGCLVTKEGLLNFGWVVDPPGFQDRNECTERQDHLWPIARSSLVCVIGSGFCDMFLEGSAPGPGGDGSGGPFCVNGPGVQVKFWPEVPSSGTMNCSVGLLGSFPNRWETWQGRVRISSQQASGPVLAWGLNWRFEA